VGIRFDQAICARIVDRVSTIVAVRLALAVHRDDRAEIHFRQDVAVETTIESRMSAAAYLTRAGRAERRGFDHVPQRQPVSPPSPKISSMRLGW